MQSEANFKNFNFSYPSESAIQEIFEQVANNQPESIAVKHGDEILTYRELNTKANVVAGLLQNRGVQLNDYVGICSNRSIEMVVGILAILKAGAAYVPIDFSLPTSRIELIFQDAAIKICLLGDDNREIQNFHDIEYIDIKSRIRDNNCIPIKKVNEADSPAYVNFSSGTSGKPKGVVCTHKGVVRLFFNQNYVSFSSNISILQSAPISFDAATFEIWAALLHGGKCVLSENDKFLSCADIKEVVANDKVNTMFLTTALFNTLVDIDAGCFEGLNTLLFGGDIASIKHVRKLYKVNDTINLVNCYGPTENTTFSTYYNIPRELSDSKQLTIPIGKPISHTQVYILNEDGTPTLVDEVGEIYLGGDGIAKEYLNDPDLTSISFVYRDLIDESTRLYKSGDFGCFNADGQIEFMGRRDSQIKINGYRGDIGEIENCINAHFTVKTGTVLVCEHNSGDKFLVAFVEGNVQHENELINYMKKNMPSYFIPQKVIWLERLPMTTTGKIDKNLLKNQLPHWMEAPEIQDEYELKTTNLVEKKLREIWSDILEIKKIKLTDNFFALGGSSLGLIKLAHSVNDAFNFNINSVNFYQNPTINYLKKAIDFNNNKKKDVQLMKRHVESIQRLSKNQLRFFSQYKLNLTSTNMNIIFKLEVDPTNVDHFMEDFYALIRNNRIFYCKTINQDEGLGMHFSPDFKPYVNINNCAGFNDNDLDGAVTEEERYMFNLLEQTPLRVRIWKTNKRVAFVFNIHHLYFDGVSMFCLKNILRKLAAGEKYIGRELDYMDFCVEDDSNNDVSNDLVNKYINYIGENRVFALSNFTNKNESSTAEGYQLSIDKKKLAVMQNHKELGISKLLLAFQKAIYLMFNVDHLKCQIPMAMNKIGDYADVLGYFINIMIYRNSLNIQADSGTQLKTIEESFRIAQTFLSINPLDIVGNEDRYDFSSILFNYIPIDEVMIFSEGFFSYEKKFYRELLVFVYENTNHIYLRIIFNKQVFSIDKMQEFCRLFAEQIGQLFVIEKALDIA